ncbi:MAG: DUF3798 domain-containing protein [Bacillota bacterium]|nr:DUF3798 domain-containing protein [Bacillota bacterium]
MKKTIALLLVILLVLPIFAACGNDAANDTGTEAAATGDDAAATGDDAAATEGNAEGDGAAYKIGIMTGTVSQGEEEYRAGQNMVEKYGADVVTHVTYPDKFAQETETTISQVASLASDPAMKAIVITQAVPGTAAAIDKVRETRDDILFILGSPHEDPDAVAKRADICMDVDQLARGYSIMELAKEMGADTFVHYSFPRHMQMQMLAARRDNLKEKAEEIGLAFYEVDAPDPTGDAGIPGAQQFILEDVPRQVANYGKNTAFFSTNCGMQEPLIKQSLEEGAIYPEQCCPSPYHAYPGALGIEIPEDKAGDVAYISEQIKAKVAEKGGTGRFGTWLIPANPTIIEAATEYASQYAQGNVARNDYDKMIEIFQSIAAESGAEANFDIYENFENFLIFTISSQIF